MARIVSKSSSRFPKAAKSSIKLPKDPGRALAIGERIATARANKQLNQQGLADLLGWQVSAVKRREGGTIECKRGDLIAIASVCEVPLAFLEDGFGAINENAVAQALERVEDRLREVVERVDAAIAQNAERVDGVRNYLEALVVSPSPLGQIAGKAGQRRSDKQPKPESPQRDAGDGDP